MVQLEMLPPNKGDANPFIAGLMPTSAIINCPVIAQPKTFKN